MSPSLAKYLFEKYPRIFEKNSMHGGFSHADGWFFLIDSLCYSISSYTENPGMEPERSLSNFVKWPLVWVSRWTGWNRIQPRIHYVKRKIPQVVALQVKEKFGGLRFYYKGGDEHVSGMVRMTEDMSYNVCELCGRANGSISTLGKSWIRSLCSSCRKPDDWKFPQLFGHIPDQKLQDALKAAEKERDEYDG